MRLKIDGKIYTSALSRIHKQIETMNSPTVLEMVHALTESKNQHTANVCVKITMGYITTFEAKEHGYGGFLNAVLSGDFESAYARADQDNKNILERFRK